MIGLIDYGSGNIHAIANIYKSLNIPFLVSAKVEELRRADRLILPGVGAFDKTMNQFHQLQIKDWLDEAVLVKKTPILGICVGMQIMANASEEGTLPGFGWIDAEVKKFDAATLPAKPHLPHLGWNSVDPTDPDHPLLRGVDTAVGFYFLHSYYMECADEQNILTRTHYGGAYASSVASANVYGLQFHPEKSHWNGIRVFENYAKL